MTTDRYTKFIQDEITILKKYDKRITRLEVALMLTLASLTVYFIFRIAMVISLW